MGNIIGMPGPAPPLVLEEQEELRSALWKALERQARSSPLARVVQRRGSASDVVAACTSGISITMDSAGMNGLHYACCYGWHELVLKLLEGGTIDVNVSSTEGYTALMLASICGHAAVVATLLAHGAQLQKRSHRGATCLHFAAQSIISLPTLRVLLGHPSCTAALVNQKGFRQRSPLMLACLAHGDAGVVRCLLEAGADPSEHCSSMANVSVLHTCAHLARVEAMRALISAGAQVDARAADGINVLQEVFVQPASRARSEASKRIMFRMLRDAGADLNATVPETQYTVLHFALASCKEEATANLLLDSPGLNLSLSINKPLALGGEASMRHTLLHLAAGRGWKRLAERLVAAGADLQKRDKDGLQPLQSAVLAGHPEVVSALLRCGADPLARCPDMYPSYAKWKLRRGLQAMQALMANGNGGDAMPALNTLFGNVVDPDSGEGPTLTAVDLACCVARDIRTVEAFLEVGARPSERALGLAEHSVPVMRAVVERPLWTPQLHAQLPPRFRTAAHQLLMCLSRPTRTADGREVQLAPDTIAAILQKAAFPVGPWADMLWYIRQRVREPLPRSAAHPEEQQAGGGGAQAGAGAGGAAAAAPGGGLFGGLLPAGAHVVQPGVHMPPFAQALMQAVQQQLPAGAGQPQLVILQQGGPAPAQGMPPGLAAAMQQAAAAALGGAAGAGGPAGAGPPAGGPAGAGAAAGGGGAPPGVQMLQHQQINQGNGQQLHVMQFAVDLPLGMMPGNPGAGAPGGFGGPPPGFLNFLQEMLAMQEMLGGDGGGGGAGPGPGPEGFLHFDMEDMLGLFDDEEEEDEEEADFGGWDDMPGLEDIPGGPPHQHAHHQPAQHGSPPAAPAAVPPAATAAASQPPAAAAAAPSQPPAAAAAAAGGISGSGPSRQLQAGEDQEEEEEDRVQPSGSTNRYNLRSRGNKRQRKE